MTIAIKAALSSATYAGGFYIHKIDPLLQQKLHGNAEINNTEMQIPAGTSTVP